MLNAQFTNSGVLSIRNVNKFSPEKLRIKYHQLCRDFSKDVSPKKMTNTWKFVEVISSFHTLLNIHVRQYHRRTHIHTEITKSHFD